MNKEETRERLKSAVDDILDKGILEIGCMGYNIMTNRWKRKRLLLAKIDILSEILETHDLTGEKYETLIKRNIKRLEKEKENG